MKRPLRILVSGMIAGDPWQGGATWAVLQYVLGLRQLGHEVLLIEPISPQAVRPNGAAFSNSDNALYFRKVTTAFGLASDAALLLAETRETVGLPYSTLQKRAQDADLLLNISGMLTDSLLAGSPPVRAYLDLDPAFNQLWSEVEGIDMRFEGHTHYVTIGQNIGKEDCPVPTCGRHWLKTLQPISLKYWPVAGGSNGGAFTTVANWRGYGSIEYQGRHYGQKAHSIRRFFDLPLRTRESFTLALSIHPEEKKDLTALVENGWNLLDPRKFTGSPSDYQEFIQTSKAELGIAKSGYAVSRCGWFSDRSICYLASGKPVMAQETGFSDFLPTGKGLFAFENTEDILRGLEALAHSYQEHSAHARRLAEELFDSDKVLSRLLKELGF